MPTKVLYWAKKCHFWSYIVCIHLQTPTNNYGCLSPLLINVLIETKQLCLWELRNNQPLFLISYSVWFNSLRILDKYLNPHLTSVNSTFIRNTPPKCPTSQVSSPPLKEIPDLNVKFFWTPSYLILLTNFQPPIKRWGCTLFHIFGFFRFFDWNYGKSVWYKQVLVQI